MQAGNGCGTNSAAQGLQICHCEAPKGPWQSREGSHDFVGTCLLSTRVLRDFHVASLLGMTNLGVSRHKIHTSNIASLQGGHSPQGHCASVRRQSRQRLRRERRYRRNRCAPFYRQPVRVGSVPPGAACRPLQSAYATKPTACKALSERRYRPLRGHSHLTVACSNCQCPTERRGRRPLASAYPTKPTHQRSSIYHADRFFKNRRSSCSQF